jgi:hypothetical protein
MGCSDAGGARVDSTLWNIDPFSGSEQSCAAEDARGDTCVGLEVGDAPHAGPDDIPLMLMLCPLSPLRIPLMS